MQPTESLENTLFSSSVCKYCTMFLNELNKNFMIDKFNVIDIDKTAFDVSKIKVVPTIVINNNRVFSGREAFSWLLNEIKVQVSAVETFGTSSVFTYIDTEKAECTMSSQFSDIEEPIVTTTDRNTDKSMPVDLSAELSKLKIDRSLS